MSVDGEFKRLTAKDRLCAAVLKAVRENDTAALRRLGLGGFAQYAGRLSELMTASVRGGLDYSPDFAALMQQVNSPVRYAHHLVNECGTAVQTALDERNGLRLRVVQPEYNDGRTKAIVGEAAESDSEHAADNLATQLGTEIKDAGNEFMRQNAEQRSRAGFKVTVERTGGANCCPWCADRIGRWELKDAPKDVFGVHDKCTCMVTYTDGRGVSTQANAAAGKWLWHPIEQNTPPLHVLTDGEKRGAGEPKRLTGGANGGKIYADSGIAGNFDLNQTIANLKKPNFFENDRLNTVLYNSAIEILREIKKHKDGTEGYIIFSSLPPFSSTKVTVGEEEAMGVEIPKCDEIGGSLHNHPSNTPISGKDLSRFFTDEKAKYCCVIGNGGKWSCIEKTDSYNWIRMQIFMADFDDRDKMRDAVIEEAGKYGLRYYES